MHDGLSERGTTHSLAINSKVSEGLFTQREGAPANWATQLEMLTPSWPLHATHLTGTVSGLYLHRAAWATF